MKITSKYVLREHVGPLLFSLSALTSLMLLNYIARKFGDLVGKGLPWRVIGEFFLLAFPFTIAMTLPMAVLVAVLYAFTRLASENEITAFKASGVSMQRLHAPALWAAAVVSVLMLLFNDQVLAFANHRLATLTGDIARARPTFLLREQVLNEVANQYVLRADRVDQTRGTMRGVTIYDMAQSTPRTIQADSGALALSKNGRDLVITLHDGAIDQLGDKPDQLRRIFYKTNLVRIPGVNEGFAQTTPGQSVAKSDREMTVCELQANYISSRREFLQARLSYEQALADSLKRPRPTALPKRRVFLGIGRLYCQAIQQAKGLAARQRVATVEATTDAGATLGAVPLEASVLPFAWPVDGQPPAGTAAQPPAAQPPATPTTQPPTPPAAATPQAQQPPATTPAPTSVPAGAQGPAPQPPATQLPSAQPPAGIGPAPTTGPVPPPAIVRPDTAALPMAAPVPLPPGTVDTAARPIAPSAGTAASPPGAPSTGNAAQAGAAQLLASARLQLRDASAIMYSYDVEIHKKFALATACFVFVLLGAPLAVRFPRGGVGLVLGISFVVFALYYCFLIAGEELATRGYLPAWIAMWAANLVFGGIGLVLALRMGTESGSNRGGGLGDVFHALGQRLARRRRRVVATAPAGSAS